MHVKRTDLFPAARRRRNSVWPCSQDFPHCNGELQSPNCSTLYIRTDVRSNQPQRFRFVLHAAVCWQTLLSESSQGARYRAAIFCPPGRDKCEDVGPMMLVRVVGLELCESILRNVAGPEEARPQLAHGLEIQVMSRSLATTLPVGAICSASHRAIEPLPQPTSRHRHPGRSPRRFIWLCSRGSSSADIKVRRCFSPSRSWGRM